MRNCALAEAGGVLFAQVVATVAVVYVTGWNDHHKLVINRELRKFTDSADAPACKITYDCLGRIVFRLHLLTIAVEALAAVEVSPLRR